MESICAMLLETRLIVFRECGHLPHEEFPQSFAEVVFDFCARELGT